MRRPLILAATLVAITLTGACSSTDDGGSSASSSTSSSDASASASTAAPDGTGVSDPLGECPHRYPGEILTAEEATVRFSPARICPGYVTVASGTEVTFVNIGAESSTVSLWNGISAPTADPTIATQTIEPGDRWAWTPPGEGVFTYRIEAIPSFSGTIEVPAG